MDKSLVINHEDWGSDPQHTNQSQVDMVDVYHYYRHGRCAHYLGTRETKTNDLKVKLAGWNSQNWQALGSTRDSDSTNSVEELRNKLDINF